MNTIRVLVYRVGLGPSDERIPNTLEALQKIVGGYVESVPLKPGVCLLVNEDGHAQKLPACAIWRRQRLVGDFLVARHDAEGEQVDISDADVRTALAEIRSPYDAGFTDGFLVGKKGVW